MGPSFRRILIAVFAGCVLGAVSASAPARPGTTKINENGLTCFNGYAYTLEGGRYRYTEHHEVRRAHGRLTTWNVTYIGAHGRILAKKHMNFAVMRSFA